MSFLLRRPRVAIALLGVVLLLPGPLLLKIRLDNAPESYFPEDAPAVVFDRVVRENFPQDQVLVALFKDTSIFSKDSLEHLQSATRALQAHPLVERVLSVSSADHIEPTADGFAVEKLLGRREISDSAAANRERALNDRFAPDVLVSGTGDAVALIVRPTPLENSLQRLELYNALLDALSDSPLESQLTAIAGHVALDVAQLKAMIRDLITLIPGTLGVSMVLLWWLFRRWLVLAVSAASISAVTGIAIGTLAILDHPFTLITAIVPPLLTALTVAMLMHLFNALSHAEARGLSGEERMRSVLDTVSVPILFTALTTACGLLSLIASPIRPIASFGLVAAIATLAGAILVVAVLPGIILFFDKGKWNAQKHGLKRLDSFTAALLRPALRRPVLVILGAGVILIGGATQIPKIEVETDLYHFFRDNHPINVATRQVESNLSGVMPLEVVFTADSMDDLKDPMRLQAVADVQAWLQAHPAVDYTTSFPDLLAEMHWAFGGEDSNARPLPDSAALVEQYLLFYDGDDLYDLVDPDYTTTRILVSLNVHGARGLNGLLSDLAAYLAAEPPADLAWDTSGMGRLFADQERLLILGQVNSLYLVAAMITLLMMLLWRSIKYTAISMIPNLAPVILIFAIMGGLGIWLDMATAMVASVAIGIAIDDTIHLLHGIKAGRDAGLGPTLVIARTVKHRGRALVATTIVLCAQFLLMTISPFQPTAIFGILTALGLLFALVFDLLVLPSLVLVTYGKSVGGRGVGASETGN